MGGVGVICASTSGNSNSSTISIGMYEVLPFGAMVAGIDINS